MVRRLTAAVALCAIVTLVARPALAQDASTPKGAVSGFFKAMEKGDPAEVKKLAVGNEKQLAILDTLVPLVSGFKQLENSAVKKWGEEARKVLSNGPGGGSFDVEKELEKAEVKENGDSATVTGATDQGKNPMQLKKVDGKWKVDLASIPTDGLDDPNAGKVLKAMADVAKSTATEIDQGKYTSAAEAKQAMGQKMLPILMQSGVGAPANPEGGAPTPPKEEPKK